MLCLGADSSAVTRHGYNALHLACQGGFEDTVAVLLDQGRVRINDQTEEGYTPLLLACYGGYEDLTRGLLNSGGR